MTELVFTRDSLLYDISNLAFVIGDVREGKTDCHKLHQTFDVCEKGNIDRVDHILRLAFAEVRAMLRPVLARERKREPDDMRLPLKSGLDMECVDVICESVRGYLVARVLADWLSITLPEAADVWREKASEAALALKVRARSARGALRRLSPF